MITELLHKATLMRSKNLAKSLGFVSLRHRCNCPRIHMNTQKTLTLTHPSDPAVITSPSSSMIWLMGPWWQDFIPVRQSSTLMRLPSQSSRLPHSDPESTWQVGRKKEIWIKTNVCIYASNSRKLFFKDFFLDYESKKFEYGKKKM
jgi:hypothetical protein